MPHRLSAGRLAVAAVVLTGSAASGAVTIFDDRGAFEAVAGADLVRESFEADPIGLLTLPYAAASSGLIVDLDPTGSYDAYITNGQVFSLPSDGVNHLSFIFGQGTYRPTFRLPADALAFGFDLSGYQDLDGSDSLEVLLLAGGQLIEQLVIDGPTQLQPGFIGITSTIAFDEVRVVIEDGGQIGFGDFVGFDQVSFALVPGPGAGLLAMIAAIAGGRGRRRG